RNFECPHVVRVDVVRPKEIELDSVFAQRAQHVLAKYGLMHSEHRVGLKELLPRMTVDVDWNTGSPQKRDQALTMAVGVAEEARADDLGGPANPRIRHIVDIVPERHDADASPGIATLHLRLDVT